MEGDAGLDTAGPAILFAAMGGVAIAVCLSTLLFLGITANHLFRLCLPRLSLSPGDPLVLSLLGACLFGIGASVCGLTAISVPKSCNGALKAASVCYVFYFWFSGLFLLAKLRAVEAGLKAAWYVKLHKLVNISTIFGTPLSSIAGGILMGGKAIRNPVTGTFFCVSTSHWGLSVGFAFVQCVISTAYLLLFIMPLLSTEKHVVELRTGDQGRGIRAVVTRNLVSCIGSMGTTCFLIVILAVADVQRSIVPGMYAASVYYCDIAVSILCLLYAIHPAWKYEPVTPAGTHSLSKRSADRDPHSKSHDVPSETHSSPKRSTGPKEFASRRFRGKEKLKNDKGQENGNGKKFDNEKIENDHEHEQAKGPELDPALIAIPFTHSHENQENIDILSPHPESPELGSQAIAVVAVELPR